MAQLLQLLQYIAKNIGTILTIIGIIEGNTSKTAQENVPFTIEDNTAFTYAIVSDPAFGLQALNTKLNSIIDDIAALPGVGDPVVLPPTAPPGYGADPSGVAGFVWAYHLASSGVTAGDQLDNAGNLSRNMATGRSALLGENSTHFSMSGTWFNNDAPDSTSGAPVWPSANILSDDSLLTFLERESGYTGWTLDADEHATVAQDSAFNDFFYNSLMDSTQFLMYRNFLFAGSVETGAPIWPGVDNVELGTPVALSDMFFIDAPMDGVVVEITSVPANTSFFDFAGTLSYRYLGALAFYTDRGDSETPQNLGFDFAVYCPKSIKQASGVSVRVKDGVTGTMTPWTLLA